MTSTRAIKLVADVLTITGIAVLLIALVTTTAALAILGVVLVLASVGLAAVRRAVAARARS